MHIFVALLGLIAFSLLLAYLAQRLRMPLAVLLVLGGIVVAFVPQLPEIALEPELALALFLPPLLQLSAYRTDWPAFRGNLRPILLLAVGAVLFSAAVVAMVAKWMVPALPWGAAVALGAIVAPPDAVAAAAVLRRLPTPKRINTVLEGESLLNDAASLVLYRFAVGATVAGSFSWGQGILGFFGAAIGGGLIGYAIGRIAIWLFALLDDTAHDITLSVLVSYAAYFAAEAAHTSGILGIVATGLVLGRRQHEAFTARTRLELTAVWSFLDFILAALIFMLIGMQLGEIVHRLHDYDPWRVAALALAVSATLIVSRFVWIVPIAWLPRRFSAALRKRDPMPPFGHLIVLSWAGMRGVVSLAAALALPLGFPGRDIIVFLAFCAIFATLILQGTTLGPLMRWLGVLEEETDGPDAAQVAARRKANEAALSVIKQSRDDPEQGAAAGALVAEYQDRVDDAARLEEACADDPGDIARQLELRLAAIEASRAELAKTRRDEDDTAARSVMQELDLEEEQIRHELGER